MTEGPPRQEKEYIYHFWKAGGGATNWHSRRPERFWRVADGYVIQNYGRFASTGVPTPFRTIYRHFGKWSTHASPKSFGVRAIAEERGDIRDGIGKCRLLK